jgi:hypothetical protein
LPYADNPYCLYCLGGAGSFLGKTSVGTFEQDPMLLAKALAGQRFLAVTTWNVAAINNNVRSYHLLSNMLFGIL